jgi:transposase
MRIIRAIVAGEHRPKVLACHRDGRCKHTKQTIAKSLQGNYREEHLFALGQALELLDYYQHKIADGDECIEKQLSTFKAQVDLDTHPLAPHLKATKRAQGNAPRFDLRTHLYRISGVDLSAIDGIDAYTALKVISEIGLDMSRWPSGKHFCSWLSLAPGTKITGGRRLSGKTKASANRAAGALRLAAQALFNSQSALGAYLRRQRARLGAPKAITATAHKLARLIYSMLKYGTAYVDAGQDCYEQQYHQRVVRNLKRKARAMGYELVKTPPEPLTA